MNISETKEHLIRTGCWWYEPWWEEDHWFRTANVNKSEFLDSIEFLKEVFTAEWVRSLGGDPLQHPFLKMVHLGQGSWQITSLHNLAERFRFLSEIDGFNRVLVSYKTLNGARSADLETFTAYLMAKECENVSFIRAKPKLGRTPDILVSNNNKEFVVECKTVSDSIAEAWVRNYGKHYSQLIMNASPDNFEVIFKLSFPEIDPYKYGYPEELGSYKIAAFIDANPIIEHLKKIGGKLKYVEMPHLGQLLVIPSDSGLRSSISIPSISQDFIGRRLLLNAIKKANQQIVGYRKPGIAVVSYAAPPDSGATQLKLAELFGRHIEEYRYLMGVLVFPAQNILKYISPTWIANPHSEFNASCYGLPHILSQSLNPIGA